MAVASTKQYMNIGKLVSSTPLNNRNGDTIWNGTNNSTKVSDDAQWRKSPIIPNILTTHYLRIPFDAKV